MIIEFIFTLEDILEILRHYGHQGDVVGSGVWMSTRCPFHHDDKPSAAVSDTGLFVCHGGCDIKGDPINVIVKKEGVDFVTAISKYEKIMGRSLPKLSGSTDRFASRGVSSRKGTLDRHIEEFPGWFLRDSSSR